MRTADALLSDLKRLREEGKPIPKEKWLDAAFDLNLFRLDEGMALEDMRQAVAVKKLAILKAQDKRNVAAAEAEIAALDEYRDMRKQELKLDVILEFVRIAKRNAEDTL